MPTISYVDPSHAYNARGDRSLRSRRGPFRAPSGALYTHLQDANSSGFGVWKSVDGGTTWSLIHSFDRQDGGGWVSDTNVEQADAQLAGSLLFIAYPYGPVEMDVDWHAWTGTVKLAVLDTTDDSVTIYDGPAMYLSDGGANVVKASCVLVAPSPDGTSAHLAYTVHAYSGLPGSGGSQSAKVGIATWDGSGFSSTTLGDSEVHPCALVNLGAGVAHLMLYEDNGASPDSVISYVLTGLVASDRQSLDTGNLAGFDNVMTGFGTAYAIGGGQYRICVPVPHAHPTATSNYIPAALVGNYSTGVITWASSAELLAPGGTGTDVGSLHGLGVYGDIATHMHAVVLSGALYVYWVAGEVASLAGTLVSPEKLQRAKYSGGSWGAAQTLYSSADLDPTYAGFADVWVSVAGLLIHPDVTDAGAPDPNWMSPYYLGISSGGSGGPANRYRGI